MSRRTALSGAFLAVLVMVGVALALRPAAQSQGPLLAIENGRLFDGTGAAVVDDGVVLIEGHRIEAAGPASAIDVPSHAATVDAAGGLIMPGVIDNHVHVTAPLVQQDDVLTPWLRDGVTTLVDSGTIRDGVQLLRDLVQNNSEEPPRVFVAGPILTAPGGYPATRPEPQAELSAQFVTGPEDARPRVADLIDDQAADLIKVAIEAGFDADYDDPGWPVLDAETLAAIAGAAHERGRTVRAHVTQEGELRAALEAGFDAAAHTPIEPLPDELLQQAAAGDMIFVSTANIWGPAGARAVRENLARYSELGGRFTIGTDFPFQPGAEMPVKEMQYLADGGIAPEQLLIAATRHGAEALGLGGQLGTLEPGKLADLIVVDGDPLADIGAMENVTVVVRDGEVVLGDVVQPPATATATFRGLPGLTPAPTAPPALPDSGGGDGGGLPVWPLVGLLGLLAVGAVTLALLAGGRLLLRR